MAVDPPAPSPGEPSSDAPPRISDDARRAMAVAAASAASAFDALRSSPDDVVEVKRFPLSASIMDHVLHASREVYQVAELRPMQRRALAKLLVEKVRQILFVDRTGGGKSHVMRLLATMLKGVHVYLCPLLSLMADVAIKFGEGNRAYGDVFVFNLDEFVGQAGSRVRKRILGKLKRLRKGTTSTYFLIGSPQFFANHKQFVDVLLNECR